MKHEDIPIVHERLMADFKVNPAPIIDFIAAQGADPFKILVATILSARTRDETTSQVITHQLFPSVSCLADLRAHSVEAIEKMIYPVGFYRQKARALKRLPEVVDAQFGGCIPETVELLCELPGVGRKTANLVVAVAFDKPAICVDVHVHRINNRLGLLKTRTPFETEMALREFLPVEYWKTWNACFVSFGQRRCKPVRPQCPGCYLLEFCDHGQQQAANETEKERDL